MRDNQDKSNLIETRSIDFIPENERTGRVWNQFTLWMGVNLQITAIVTGALAVVLGGDVFWTLIGLFIGQIFGGLNMALHAAKGPRLGLPQMISSRVQFGVFGATIPMILVCLMYLGFSATGILLSGQAVAQLINVSNSFGILIFATIIIIAATLGYHIIHIVGKFASMIGIIAFIYLFTKILSVSDLSQLLAIKEFNLKAFLLAISLSFSWQVAFGPYVADYARYLPSHTKPWKVCLAVGSGSVISSQIAMTLGVFAVATASGQFSGNEVSYIVNLGGTGLIASFLYFSIVLGKVTITTLNSYGSFMCLATIFSAFSSKINFTKLQRLYFVLFIVGLATCLALAGQNSFLNAFKSFILFLLTFFVPWSSISLVDYYFITKKYDIKALYDPNGIYGKWNKTGISIYIIGILIQLPFIATGLYTGPLVAKLGGVDISWIIGLSVPAIIYYLVAKKNQIKN